MIFFATAYFTYRLQTTRRDAFVIQFQGQQANKGYRR